MFRSDMAHAGGGLPPGQEVRIGIFISFSTRKINYNDNVAMWSPPWADDEKQLPYNLWLFHFLFYLRVQGVAIIYLTKRKP
jgi:hypothetical protein